MTTSNHTGRLGNLVFFLGWNVDNVVENYWEPLVASTRSLMTSLGMGMMLSHCMQIVVLAETSYANHLDQSLEHTMHNLPFSFSPFPVFWNV